MASGNLTSGGAQSARKRLPETRNWPLRHLWRGCIIATIHQEQIPMHDIVIRGGTIVDGTGKAAYTGDVAMTGGVLSGVGGKHGPARREIDAHGLLVTPGWVDIHTHYDGQAMW